jgi:hypothetical protein
VVQEGVGVEVKAPVGAAARDLDAAQVFTGVGDWQAAARKE